MKKAAGNVPHRPTKSSRNTGRNELCFFALLSAVAPSMLQRVLEIRLRFCGIRLRRHQCDFKQYLAG